MANKKSKTRSRKLYKGSAELDSVYLLKLVLYLIVGAQWIRLENTAGTTQIPIPIGLIIGFLFASHDHFKIDRKIEYAVLLVAMFVGFWSQVGIYITF
jgi:hypothetical protein